jgi:predicted hydrocarbon binding protein
MMKNVPLYNSVVIKTYIDYLKNNYPNVNTKELLAFADISNFELEDRGHWLTQNQVNRFQEYVQLVTANPNIAREAGRHIVSTKSSSVIRQTVAGFLSPSIAYWAVEKLGSTLSRHQTMKIKKLADNKIEIFATPKKDVKEELFQCENRLGMFEALAEVFTKKYPDIEHTECIHRGDSHCRYIITWEIPTSALWSKAANYSFVLSIITSIPLFFFLPLTHWLIFLLFSLLISGALLLNGTILHDKAMMGNLEDQGKASDQLFEQIELRYNELLLVREIGEAAPLFLNLKSFFTLLRIPCKNVFTSHAA